MELKYSCLPVTAVIIIINYHLFVLILSLCHLPTTNGVVYYVKPTKPCAHNSSCPSNEICHTMDHYASNSSHYFSPDHINVTLYFMCGVHNCSRYQYVTVHDLQVFAMEGLAGRKNVVINIPIPTKIPQNPINVSKCAYFITNVSKVRIENATVNFISLCFRGQNCLLITKSVDYFGHVGTMSAMVSFINISHHSQAILEDCTFQNNTFLRLQSSAVLTIRDTMFHSFHHAVRSVVALDNSTVKLTGNVAFINNEVGNEQHYNICGAAVVVNSAYNFYIQAPISIFNITSNAQVLFINNRASSCGGAIYLKSTVMNVDGNATVTLKGNAVIGHYGHGHPLRGGAMYTEQSPLNIEQAEVKFMNNFILGEGYGGALFQIEGNVSISDHAKIRFVNNSAWPRGGAIYLSTSSDISVDTHSELIFSHNLADQGGAIYLQPLGSIIVGNSSYVEFSHNTAKKYGGAIYVDDQTCFFVFDSWSSKVTFKDNHAKEGVGTHIYGASVASTNCMHSKCYNIVNYEPNISSNLSPVSSSSKRVCLCDSSGKPQCAKFSSIFLNQHKVYRGESFNLSAVIVGYDFGVTHGTINAGPVRSNNTVSGSSRLRPEQYHQWTGKKNCSNVTYNLYSNKTQETLYLHSLDLYYMYGDEDYVKSLISYYNYWKHKCADMNLFTTPVYVNITLLDGCPPGFNLTLQNMLYGCYCFPVLQNSHFDCYITNNAGYLEWNSTMWVNATFNEYDGILLAQRCPLGYCRSGQKTVNLGRDPNTQCANNHAGILCGRCGKNFSLAIGSSSCIECSNDNGLLIILLFIAAGFLLVIFILVLNLTVTQGLINGLIFYANILWIYKDVLFPSDKQTLMNLLQVFVAWINLDFGIEMCLVVDLTAFWKTWLQFLFPLYIWLIAGVIIIACHYSSHLTNLIGDRAVPLLATLFFLSYTKLLRTVMTILEYGELIHFPEKSKTIVWYLDGNLRYCKYPHIILFIVAIITLIFCLSFTLFLLLIQFWRKISHLRLLRWINLKFTPFYDAFFATLRNKHHYWFGLLLLTRVALQIVFTATLSTQPLLGLLILFISLAMLLLNVSLWFRIHKFKLIRFLESISLLNLLVLVGCMLYMGESGFQTSTLALQLSIGFSFVQFLVIIIISMLKLCCHNYWYRHTHCSLLNDYTLSEESENNNDSVCYERLNDHDASVSAMYDHASPPDDTLSY